MAEEVSMMRLLRLGLASVACEFVVNSGVTPESSKGRGPLSKCGTNTNKVKILIFFTLS